MADDVSWAFGDFSDVPGLDNISNAGGSAQASNAVNATNTSPNSSRDITGSGINWANLATLGLPLGALAYGAATRNKPIPYEKTIAPNANALITSGQQMMAPLMSGAPLPVGAEAAIQGQGQGNVAQILSNAAASGQGMYSTATQSALAGVNIQEQQARFAYASSLATQGAQNIMQGDRELAALAQQHIAQDQNFSNSLSNVAKAFSGVSAQDAFKEVGNLIGGVEKLFL